MAEPSTDPDLALAAASAAFWRDPPWRGGRTSFRMALRPLTESEWLSESIGCDEYQRKLMLFSGFREQVLARLAGHEDLVTTVAETVRMQLIGRGFADHGNREQDALVRTALMVPDDLCVLAPSPQGYRLVAASLCSPSYWRLADKIGRSIADIHAPVRGLEAALGPMMARFFEKLPVGQIFARRNWNIHREAVRFHPDPEVWDPAPEGDACARLFVRTELQTLRKFDNQALLFTIGVGNHRLAGIRHYPEAIDDLLRAIGAMSADERQAFGYQHHGDALCGYLKGLRSS